MTRSAVALLLGLAALAAVLLTLLQALAGPSIDAERLAAAERAMLDLLPAELYDNHPLAQPVELQVGGLLGNTAPTQGYLATLAGRPSAVLLPVDARGYVGEIRLLVAISPDGRLIGSKVLRQQETAGLGDLLQRSPWLSRFNGLSLDAPTEHWLLREEGGAIDQISGATVSSRAARDALQRALRYFDAHRSRLLHGAAP
jgi:electron transport complex protein RnfG